MFEDHFPKRWRVRYVQRFTSQIFAYTHVIIPAANNKKQFKSTAPASIKKRSWRAHVMWFHRVKEMVCRELWLPSPSYNNSMTKLSSVQRCMYCRPTHLLYKDKDNDQLSLCGRYSICPFCYARQAEDLYKRVSRAIKQLQKQGKPIIATCRIETYPLKARDFEQSGWDIENMYRNAGVLRNVLGKEIEKYAMLKKDLRKHTHGSLWRVAVNPSDTGWELQIRQFYLTRPKAKRPAKRARKSAAIFLQSAKISDFDATMSALGEFVSYPQGLLTGYAELTAASLHARNGLRLSNATGCLYRKGRVKRAAAQCVAKTLPFLP